MKERGYGIHDVARIERQDRDAPLFHEGRRRALANILDIPEWWFTRESQELFVADSVVRNADADLEQAQAAIRELRAGLGSLVEELERLRRPEEPAYPSPPGELGHRATSSPPNGEHRQQDANPQAAETQQAGDR